MVVDKADVGNILYAVDVENRQLVEVVHNMTYDFEVLEEDCEDQKNSFARFDLEGHLVSLAFYLLFHSTLARFLSLDFVDSIDRFL
jgi:hypothetical protein